MTTKFELNIDNKECWLQDVILDFTNEAIVVTNGKDLLYANRGLEALLGYSLDEIVAFPSILSAIAEHEYPIVKARLKDRLEGKIVPNRYETAIRQKSGGIVPVEISIKVIRLEPEPRIVAVMRDITERKHMENTLKQNYEALKQLDRMKSDFVNAVSHELRTPLTSVLGYAEFLEDEMGGPLTEAQRTHVAEILCGARKLQALVDDLLDFNRLQNGQFKLDRHDVDLSGEIRRAVDSVRPDARKAKVHLHTEIPQFMLVNVDAPRISQAILNLLSNAIKFTPPGGEIRVKAQQFEDAVLIEVRDNGCGIPTDAMQKLFTRFFQADPSTTRQHGGVGLGLAIVKEIVQAHGGEVFAESEVGKGSNFWFRIPA